MGQITGNDKDFPTIKQVNDTLSSAVGGTLDISEYFDDLFNLTDTTPDQDTSNIKDNEYNELDNQHIIEMLEKIIQVKPTILKGISENTDVDFETSNIKWCISSILDNDNYVNQWIISFKIYVIIYGASYHFVFVKSLNTYNYSKYFVDSNGF